MKKNLMPFMVAINEVGSLIVSVVSSYGIIVSKRFVDRLGNCGTCWAYCCILCIQRSLHHGFKMGFMTGLCAALADGVYGLVAATGLTVVSSFLTAYQFWIQSLGGLFLLYLGIKLFFSKPSGQNKITNNERSVVHALLTAFVLTLTNPATILAFIAIFAGLGIGAVDNAIVDQAL